METSGPDDLPVVFETAGAEIRAGEVGGMTIAFYRLPAGVDARPLLRGLPGGACHCPREAREIWRHLQQHLGVAVAPPGWCTAVEMRSSIRRCDRTTAPTGFVQANGVGLFFFQARM